MGNGSTGMDGIATPQIMGQVRLMYRLTAWGQCHETSVAWSRASHFHSRHDRHNPCGDDLGV